MLCLLALEVKDILYHWGDSWVKVMSSGLCCLQGPQLWQLAWNQSPEEPACPHLRAPLLWTSVPGVQEVLYFKGEALGLADKMIKFHH